MYVGIYQFFTNGSFSFAQELHKARSFNRIDLNEQNNHDMSRLDSEGTITLYVLTNIYIYTIQSIHGTTPLPIFQ